MIRRQILSSLAMLGTFFLSGCGLIHYQHEMRIGDKVYRSSSEPEQVATRKTTTRRMAPAKRTNAVVAQPVQQIQVVRQVAQPSKPPVEPWMLELPSVAEIKERTRVADPEQSVFRDRIARRILAEYISFRCGFTTDRVMFGVADTVMSMQNQYFGGRTDLDEAEIQSAFNRGMAYHVEVLSDVLPAKAVQAYTWTQGFQEAKAADDVYQAERREREAKRLKLEDMERRIQADKVDGVDRRVLGIEIGEPLNLPQCDGGTGSNNSAGFDLAMAMLKDPLGTFQGEFQGSAQTCLGDPIARSSLGMLEAVQLARGEPISPVPVVAVKIANSSCPDWLQLKGLCIARLEVKDGMVLGLSVSPNGDFSAKVEKQLIAKYGSNFRRAKETTRCVNQQTGAVVDEDRDYIWNLPGLDVTYSPISPYSCGFGLLTVRLDYLTKLRRSERVKHEASEPGL